MRLPALAIEDTSIVEQVEHPEIRLVKTYISYSELALKSLKKSILPRLTIWSTGYGRGSGASSSDGLVLNKYNYGLGAQISFSVLEALRQKPLWHQQQLLVAASRDQLNQTALQLSSQKEIADAAMLKYLQAARLAPKQYTSALFSYKAIRARYQSGLINYYDVVQAQQILVQSEASVKIASYMAWKSQLGKAASYGNINLFLNQFGR